MHYTTLIRCTEAFSYLHNRDWVFIDCRFTLNDAGRGALDYQRSHIPGAVYAHLNDDLSGRAIPGKTGRHPLPDAQALAQRFSQWGIDAHTQVVAYDGLSGSMAAARLWWLLRWAGHEAVAVLDGGFKCWVDAGYPCAGGVEAREKRVFTPKFNPGMVSTAEEVQAALNKPGYLLLDSRSPDRYRGENETIDPVAGHIPGAISAPFMDNVTADGILKSPGELKDRFQKIAGNTPADHVVFYCGSGVTAAHNVLAFSHADMGMPRMYAGSWSDWITQTARPVAKG